MRKHGEEGVALLSRWDKNLPYVHMNLIVNCDFFVGKSNFIN